MCFCLSQLNAPIRIYDQALLLNLKRDILAYKRLTGDCFFGVISSQRGAFDITR